MLHTERNLEQGKIYGVTYNRKQQTCMWTQATVRSQRTYNKTHVKSKEVLIDVQMKQNDRVVNSVHCYLDTQPAALIIRRENCEVEATEKVETE